MMMIVIGNRKTNTCTEHWAAITPSTGASAKGSKLLSARRMKSGLRRYPQFPLYSNLPWFSCIGRSEVWKFRDTIWQPAFQNTWKRKYSYNLSQMVSRPIFGHGGRSHWSQPTARELLIVPKYARNTQVHSLFHHSYSPMGRWTDTTGEWSGAGPTI